MSIWGFGTEYDLKTGRSRQWYMKRGDVKRWADNDHACEGCPKCGGQMKPGQALEQACTGSPDFPGCEVATMSPGGPANGRGERVTEGLGNDANQATRRAIVRAAASLEVGE